MSTTTEKGWTKVFPQVEGFYFARRTQTSAPALTVIQVWQYEDEWYAYRFARNEDIEAADFVRSLYEYLGPLQPEDFEQLAALRRLVVHMRVHSAYHDNGYMQMTTPQKELYDAIWNQSVAELDAEETRLAQQGGKS